MPALKNTKHERFAQELAKGQTADAAYAAAGYSPDRKNAARLTTNDGVRTRVAELQERAAIRAEVTVADIAAQLDEDRALAHKVGQPGAAVSASLGKAKVLGLIVDKTELTGKDGGPVEVSDARERLARIIAGEVAAGPVGEGARKPH